MKNILIIVGILGFAGVVFAAPTSTIVNNLFILSLKDATTPCLTVNSLGFIATSTCGTGGGGSATTTINSILGPTFTFASGTTGTDFNIVGTAGTITFNLPSATSTVRGLLTSSDWTTFNNKLTNAVIGGGTTNYIPKWSNASSITNSLFYDDGTSIGISKTDPQATLEVFSAATGLIISKSPIGDRNVDIPPLEFRAYFNAGAWGGSKIISTYDGGGAGSHQLEFWNKPSDSDTYVKGMTLGSTGVLTITSNVSAANLSGTNTGDETKATITSKLAIATSTGSLIVGSSTTGWVGLTVGSNGLCLVASSTAPSGLSWETCATGSGITSLNGLTGATQTFSTSTSANTFNIISSGTNHQWNIPSNVGFFSNDVGYVTSSGGGGSVSTSSAITVNNFPFWTSTGGALSGTSTLTVALWNATVASTTLWDKSYASSSFISPLIASSTFWDKAYASSSFVSPLLAS